MAEAATDLFHMRQAGGTRVLSAGDAGSSVLLIHGVGMNASVWAPQLSGLSAGHRVFAHDMLDHGAAPDSDTAAPGLRGYVEQILAVSRDLGLQRFHIVGHSMGALVATAFALDHPGRILSLTALNAVWQRDPESRAAVLARAGQLGTGNKSDTDKNAISRWFGEPVAPRHRQHAALALAALTEVRPEAYARSYGLFARSDRAHEGRLEELAMPALFMTGAGDPNSTPAMSEAMAALAPRGRAVILAGERHMMPLTAPDLVNQQLLAMFGQADAG